MTGIIDYSIYLPHYYIRGETLSSAWNQPPNKLAKRIANFDEDSLTMAAAAALTLNNSDKSEALLFASTTFPYKEKLCASILAPVLKIPHNIRTIDITGSLRGGTAALLSAYDSVKAGSVSHAVIVAADQRLTEPGAPEEITLGDAAAAITMGKKNLAAEIISYHSTSNELIHIWRKQNDQFIKSGDIRFSEQYGYIDTIVSCAEKLLEKSGVSVNEISKVIIPIPDMRPIKAVCQKLGFDMKTQWHDPLTGLIGYTGTPHPFILLASALDNSKPDEKILLLSYGDGCDALLLQTTELVSKLAERQIVKKALSKRRELTSYAKYLDFRNILGRWDWLPNAFSSTIMEYRHSSEFLGLSALKCRKCGTILSLPLPVCPSCRAEKEFDRVQLGRKGKIFTFSQEHYYPSPEPPVTMAVIDLDTGGRILVQMTDCDFKDVKVEMNVELVFRKMHEANSFINYYWKAVPV
ncbi:MAG: OB-fold domain-containing protein [Planctomycetota bacterium]